MIVFRCLKPGLHVIYVPAPAFYRDLSPVYLFYRAYVTIRCQGLTLQPNTHEGYFLRKFVALDELALGALHGGAMQVFSVSIFSLAGALATGSQTRSHGSVVVIFAAPHGMRCCAWCVHAISAFFCAQSDRMLLFLHASKFDR